MEIEKKILVVDDSAITRKLLKNTLSKENYNIETAENGMEALEKIYQTSYDLITIDLNMPNMGGLQLVEKIRDEDDLKELPLIILSTVSNKKIIKKVIDSGANLYIEKPPSDAKLISSIKMLIDRYSNNND